MTENQIIKVLHVEDVIYDRIAVQRTLERQTDLRFELVAAASLEEAMQKKDGANLILLDLSLPDARPEQALAAIGDLPPPLIVVSGDVRESTPYLAGRYGACAVVGKAVLTQRLPNAIRFALGRCATQKVLPDDIVDQLDQQYHAEP